MPNDLSADQTTLSVSGHNLGYDRATDRLTRPVSDGSPVSLDFMISNIVALSDWEMYQHAARLNPAFIRERARVVAMLHRDTGRQPISCEPLDIVRWFADHRDDWSDSTAATYYSYVKAWYHWLQVQDRRVDNPMVKIPAPRYPDREPRPMSDAHLPILLTSRMHHRTRVMILLAALAGLRVGTLCKVRGEDIDPAKQTLRVTTKRSKVRTIPLHPLLVDAAATMPAKGWWFPGNSEHAGQHILAKSTSDIIGRAMRRAGVPGTPHSLRHWFGTTLLDDGADLRTVQELMMHQSIQSTALYTKVPDRRRIGAIAQLDPFRGLAAEPFRIHAA